MAGLYRKSSLDKLSRLDQLDKTITISSSMSWLALIGIALVISATIAWLVFGTLPTTVAASGVIVSPEYVCAEFSDYTGTVEKLYIDDGADFSEGDKIADIKTMDGKIMTVTASSAGKAFFPLKNTGETVYAGSEIVRYTPAGASDLIAVCYVPSAEAQQLKKDMRVLIYPSSVDCSKYGHLEATIRSVEKYSAEVRNMAFVLGSGNSVAEQFAAEGPVTAVVCELKTDPATKSGYCWSSSNGKEQVLLKGTFVSAKIVSDECAPIAKLFGINLKSEG